MHWFFLNLLIIKTIVMSAHIKFSNGEIRNWWIGYKPPFRRDEIYQISTVQCDGQFIRTVDSSQLGSRSKRNSASSCSYVR